MPKINLKVQPGIHLRLKMYQSQLALKKGEFVPLEEASETLVSEALTKLFPNVGGSRPPTSLESGKDEFVAIVSKFFEPASKEDGEFLTTSEMAETLNKTGLNVAVSYLGVILRKMGFKRTTKTTDSVSIKGYYVKKLDHHE